MKIHPAGAKLFHADGRTDGSDEASSCCGPFGEHAYKFYVPPAKGMSEIF
jgi:hypothetical protein